MHILEELYVGSIRPGERSFKQNRQYSRAIKAFTECEEKLDATFFQRTEVFRCVVFLIQTGGFDRVL